MTQYANELANPDGADPNRMVEITREHGIEHIEEK
jgi:hypothetical protein